MKKITEYKNIDIFLTEDLEFSFTPLKGHTFIYNSFEECKEYIDRVNRRDVDVDIDIILDHTIKAKITKISKDNITADLVHITLIISNNEYVGYINKIYRQDKFFVNVTENGKNTSYLCFVNNKESIEALKVAELSREKATEILIKNNEILIKHF